MINSTIIVIKQHTDNNEEASKLMNKIMHKIETISDRVNKYSMMKVTDQTVQVLVDFEGLQFELKDDISYGDLHLPIDVVMDYALLGQYH